MTVLRHRGGTLNLRLGRATRKVPGVLRRHRLDWLAVQELNGRGSWLSNRLGERWRVVVGPDGDSALIVRADLRVQFPARHHLGGVEWERGKGRPGLHPSRMAASARVGGRDGYRVLVYHGPPGPHYDVRFPLRRAASDVSLERLAAICRRWSNRGRGWVAVGDFNVQTADPRVRSLAARLRASIVGWGIDYALASEGLRVSHMRAHRVARTDHKLRTFLITKES